jgi:hypothetical protein
MALISPVNYAANAPMSPTFADAWQSVKSDYNNFYSRDRWERLGVAFAVGGVIANTKADQEIQNAYQEHARNSSTDDVAKFVKVFGDWKILVPASLAAAAMGVTFPRDTGSTIGIWGERTFRAYLAAAPAMFVGQRLTGASRPEERNNASHWRPLRDDNGVSGHAFVAAVPFITIAQMTDDPVLRYASYAASALTAWSRVNDNAHFTSQVLLGWYMGYEAVNAVSKTSANSKPLTPQFSLAPWGDGAEVQVAYQW